MKTEIFITECDAYCDLAVKHYGGKWKHAKEYVSGGHDAKDRAGMPYWNRVRLVYLELGGEYVEQLKIMQKLQYSQASDMAYR